MFERPGLAKDQLLVAGVGLKFLKRNVSINVRCCVIDVSLSKTNLHSQASNAARPKGSFLVAVFLPQVRQSTAIWLWLLWLMLTSVDSYSFVNFLKVFAGIFFCNVHQRGAEGVPWWNSLIFLARQLDRGNQTRSRHIMIYIYLIYNNYY